MRSLVNGREIFIIFALNPDGMRFDLTGDPFRAWRKNRQPNAGSTAVGTDLNRNYGYKWGCCGGSSGNTVVLHVPRRVGVVGARDARVPGLRREPRGRRRPADQGAHHAPHQRRADPVAVRLHVPQRAAGHDDRSTGRRSWPWAVPRPRRTATRRSSRPSCTSPTATRSTGCTRRTGSSASPTSSTRPRQPTVWTRPLPRRLEDRRRRRRATAGAILHLINRASCPYAALGADATRANCGPLFDDLEINRGWTRNAHGTDTADAGLWSVTNPSGHELQRRQAADDDLLRLEGAGHRRSGRARARTRTTSTAARRRSAAARSASPRAPRRTARSRSATTSPTAATPPPPTRCG